MPAIARRDRVEEAEDARSVKDPVCGMIVDPHTAKHRREHGGRTYYFCSAHCAEKFEAAPEEYLKGERPKAKPAPDGRHLHLPDAPRDRAGRAGRLPDLRHGARAQDRRGRGGAERRVPRHAPPVLDQRRAVAAAPGLGHGRPPARAWAGPRDLRAGWRTGSSWRWRRRSCSGPAGRSSSAAGPRSSS